MSTKSPPSPTSAGHSQGSRRYTLAVNRSIIMFASLALAILGGVLFSVREKRFVHHVTGGQFVTIVRIAEPIARGDRLLPGNMVPETRPAAYVEARHVRYAERFQVLNAQVNVNLSAGSALVRSDIFQRTREEGHGASVSDVIPPGYRALGARLASRTLATLLHEGDRADVFLTTDDADNKATVLLAQNVRIVRDVEASLSVDDDRTGRVRFRDVTFLVEQSQAAVVAHGMKTGRISFAVRSRDEADVSIDSMPYVSNGDFADERLLAFQGRREDSHLLLRTAEDQ